MKFATVQGTEIALRVFLDRRAKFFRQPGRLKPRQRQMWGKRALFTRDAQFFCGSVDISRQSLQVRRRNNACPENAWMFFVGKETEPAKIQSDELLRPHT